MSEHTRSRLLFVDHTPFAGGAQLVLAEHIQEMDKDQFEVFVACSDTVPSLVDRYQSAGATTIIMSFPTLRRKSPVVLADFGRSVWKLRQIIRDEKIDLVVSNTTRASYIASLATLGLNTQLIWWVRDFLYPKLLFRLLRFIPVKIICVSNSIKQSYMDKNDPKGVVVYVANSIYKRLPAITKKDIHTEKTAWNIEADSLVVGFMGRLVAEKGAEDVVDAVKTLSNEFPTLRLLMVGTGKGQMHDVEGYLKKKVEKDKLQEIVTFAGYQENEALYYSLFDIFVLSTRDREPFATSVVQAMMSGCAVIGTNAGGTPEIITHNETGLLYEPGNVNDLASQISRLAHDADVRHRISANGQEYVLQYHREETVTDQLEQLYKQAIRS